MLEVGREERHEITILESEGMNVGRECNRIIRKF